METFLGSRWRSLLLGVGLLAAVFVWPTLYKPTIVADHRQDNGHIDVLLFRENRLTGKVETYAWARQRWEVWHKDVYRPSREARAPQEKSGGPNVAADQGQERLEKGTRSLHANLPTEVRFENKSGRTVKIYWLDYSGNRKLYQVLANDRTHVQQTFVTHPWLITGEDDRGWQVFFPDSQPRTVVIQAPPDKT